MDIKHRIPDELLGVRYKGGRFYATKSGKVYGNRGYSLKVKDSCHGLNHPVKFDKNLWWVLGSMFVPNPNGYRHAVRVDGQIYWVSDLAYSKMIRAWTGKVCRDKLKDEVIEEALHLYEGGMRIVNIARKLNVSRTSIYRILK